MDAKKKARFYHDTLPDCRTHIRLLKINEDSSDDSSISCELSTWPLDVAPAYDAISYTWGNPDDTTSIFLNSLTFSVRRNCWTVLQQIRALCKNEYIWIDAICISQDDTAEKSAQVSIFDQIYRKAETVYACVGSHEKDSTFLCEYMRDRRRLLTKIFKGLYQSDSSGGDWTTQTPTVVGTRNILRCFLSTDFKTRRRLIHTFVAFLQRPYFSRVWVLQELFLGRSIRICCGKDVIDFNQLFALRVLVEIWTASRHFHWGWYPHPLLSFTLEDAVKRIIRQSLVLRRVGSCLHWNRAITDLAPQLGVLTLGWRNSLCTKTKPMNLPDVLHGMRNFHCQDSRDRLYGISSLLRSDEAPWTKAFQADYSKTTVELVAELIPLLYDPESPARQLLPLHSPLGLAKALLFDVFRCPSEEAVTELERVTHSHPSHGKPPRPNLLTSADPTWYGIELAPQPNISTSSSSEWTPFLADEYTTTSSPKIVNKNGTLLGYAPEATRAGDWLLMEMAECAWLVVRPSATGKHGILGLVSQVRRFSLGWGLPKVTIACLPLRFEVWWEVRDLLVLAWEVYSYREMARWGGGFKGASLEWMMGVGGEGFGSFACGPRSTGG